MPMRRVRRAIRFSLAAAVAILVAGTGMGAGPAQAAAPAGQLRALVLRLTWAGADSSGADGLDSEITGSVDSWMRTASRGLFSGWSVTDPGLITIPEPALSPGDNACDYVFRRAIEAPADQVAADRGDSIGDFDVVLYAAPPKPCSDFGEVGGLHVHLYGYAGPPTLIHELGHHLGLGHGHLLTCFDASRNPVTLSATCATNEYGDYPNEMGSGPGIYSAIELASLGWLPGLVQDVPLDGGQYSLQPLDTLAGGTPLTRALRVQDGQNILWVEYRQPGSLDSSTHDQGVFIHLQRSDDFVPDGSFLLSMNPASGSANLPAGSSWTDPLGVMMITVDSADASSARITVTNTSAVVPSVISSGDAAARAAITDAGLTVGAVTSTASCAVLKGGVVTQNPQPGVRVPRGTPVNLQESTGKQPNGKPCVIS